MGIALQHMAPDLEVSASDISPPALEVAALNAEKLLGRRLPAVHFGPAGGCARPFDVIASNPPYLRDDEVADMRKLGWPEPELALRGRQ